MPRIFACVAVAAVSLVVVQCGGEGTGPVPLPTTVIKISGDQQTGAVREALPIPLVVQVNDQNGVPMPDVAVAFTATLGDGALSVISQVTGPNGQTPGATWYLGTPPGSPQQATAAVTGLAPATFSATAITGFTVAVQYFGIFTVGQQNAVAAAAVRWGQLVVGDLADIYLDPPPVATCGGVGFPSQSIDDVLILVSIVPIDGPGGILGSAGPCYIRTANTLPIIGAIRLDSADAAMLEDSGLFDEAVMHEMGHVLGFGTLWGPPPNGKGLLADAVRDGGTDPHFVGLQGLVRFDASGGTSYVGAKVPVENTGGPGTADGHWRESVFDSELMTGFVDLGTVNPLSAVTLGAMADLGYLVNYAGVDPYLLPTSGAGDLRIERGRHLGDDLLREPLRLVDAFGKVTRVVSPR